MHRCLPPAGSIWDGVSPEPFERQRLPMAEQLNELFKERRSIRRFKREKIERALLEEIGQYGGYAPTHAFSLRVIIVSVILVSFVGCALSSFNVCCC